MIQKSKIKSYVREKEKRYRIASDVYPALDEAVRTLLNRAIKYLNTKKTIRGKDIMMAVTKESLVPTRKIKR